MLKKLVVWGIALVMLFSLTGLSACDNIELAQYKATAMTDLTDYAAAKGESNYSEENWAVIQQIVADGKETIDAAATKPAVNTARDKAKADIDAVSQSLTAELESRIKADFLQEFKYEFWFDRFYGLYNGAAVFFIEGITEAEKTVTILGIEFSYNRGWTIIVWKDGVFYDLEDIEVIFDAGILTQTNLERIGAVHAETNASEATEEDEMTAELENRIKEDYLQEFGYELYFGDELLNKFYGLYNGAAVFFIAGADAAEKTAIISGVAFSYNYGWTILVWKDGIFYDLEDIEVIFDAGILTQNDLEQIGAVHAEANAK